MCEQGKGANGLHGLCRLCRKFARENDAALQAWVSNKSRRKKKKFDF